MSQVRLADFQRVTGLSVQDTGSEPGFVDVEDSIFATTAEGLQSVPYDVAIQLYESRISLESEGANEAKISIASKEKSVPFRITGRLEEKIGRTPVFHTGWDSWGSWNTYRDVYIELDYSTGQDGRIHVNDLVLCVYRREPSIEESKRTGYMKQFGWDSMDIDKIGSEHIKSQKAEDGKIHIRFSRGKFIKSMVVDTETGKVKMHYRKEGIGSKVRSWFKGGHILEGKIKENS